MKFSMEVGELEKSLIEVEFDPAQGRTVVRNNGRELVHEDSPVSRIKVQTMRFTVGTTESWDVRLEKQPALFGPTRWLVFVGGRLAKVFPENRLA